MTLPIVRTVFTTFVLAFSTAVLSSDLASELTSLQSDWARTQYTMSGDAQLQSFERLTERAETLATSNPANAEVLIWKGIVLSTRAAAQGGMGALGLAKQARAALERAIKINSSALNGLAYTSLGALYTRVPGFPVGFGDKDKAHAFLQKALAINPASMDANYYFAELLFEERKYREALQHLDIASQAPPRPGREIADAGRRKEIEALRTKTRAKLDR